MDKLDTHHQEVYTEEAVHYDKRRFSSRRGQLSNYYEARAIARLLSPLNGRKVLDVPTGTGRIALELVQAGAEVTAADLTPAMMHHARSKTVSIGIGTGKISFVNANGRQLPFPDQYFDVVISIRFLHLIPPSDWPWFLREMRRVVKPEGRVLVQLFNPLYGGPMALARELHRRLVGEPGERFVWPHQINNIFASANLEVASITSYWLPGMSLLGSLGSPLLNYLTQACEKRPLSWLAGPHHVLAQPV